MHRKHVLLPSREPVFACECLLFFRCPRLRIRGFKIGTRASRATSFIISTAVIWYIVLFRQNRTDRPVHEVCSPSFFLPLLPEIRTVLENTRHPAGRCQATGKERQCWSGVVLFLV